MYNIEDFLMESRLYDIKNYIDCSKGYFMKSWVYTECAMESDDKFSKFSLQDWMFRQKGSIQIETITCNLLYTSCTNLIIRKEVGLCQPLDEWTRPQKWSEKSNQHVQFQVEKE